jgi:hypothetical protein
MSENQFVDVNRLPVETGENMNDWKQVGSKGRPIDEATITFKENDLSKSNVQEGDLKVDFQNDKFQSNLFGSRNVEGVILREGNDDVDEPREETFGGEDKLNFQKDNIGEGFRGDKFGGERKLNFQNDNIGEGFHGDKFGGDEKLSFQNDTIGSHGDKIDEGKFQFEENKINTFEKDSSKTGDLKGNNVHRDLRPREEKGGDWEREDWRQGGEKEDEWNREDWNKGDVKRDDWNREDWNKGDEKRDDWQREGQEGKWQGDQLQGDDLKVDSFQKRSMEGGRSQLGRQDTQGADIESQIPEAMATEFGQDAYDTTAPLCSELFLDAESKCNVKFEQAKPHHHTDLPAKDVHSEFSHFGDQGSREGLGRKDFDKDMKSEHRDINKLPR